MDDTLARYRRVLGNDHAVTLRLAHSWAAQLRAHGAYQQAHRLDEDTLGRYRRVLGDDHPDTLRTAHHLAIDLRALGEFAQALW
jgi:Tetratricopeptide repeat